MTELQHHLAALGACREACAWAGTRSSRQAWEDCERPDWLLWWAARTAVNSRGALVEAAAVLAHMALLHVPRHDEASLRAIVAAERWSGDQSVERGVFARKAAWDAWLAVFRAVKVKDDPWLYAARAAAWTAEIPGWTPASKAPPADMVASDVLMADAKCPSKHLRVPSLRERMCEIIRRHLACPYA